MRDTRSVAGLWQAVRMHDERNLALIDADRRRLVRAATRMLGEAEAEDAVQDAYVRALEAQTHELNAAQAWLLTVVRNVAIDRLRRRQWMQQWLTEMEACDAVRSSPSAEMDAALAEEVTHILRLLAACLTPSDGASVLLHEVFEVSHAEIAQASGRSEAGSRQLLRRALLRLRQARGEPRYRPNSELDPAEETVLRSYLQALQLRDPQVLWAMLGQPPISALAGDSGALVDAASASRVAACGVVQAGGQLGLVFTLDGVTLCTLPLGVRTDRELEVV